MFVWGLPNRSLVKPSSYSCKLQSHKLNQLLTNDKPLGTWVILTFLTGGNLNRQLNSSAFVINPLQFVDFLLKKSLLIFRPFYLKKIILIILHKRYRRMWMVDDYESIYYHIY